MEFLLPFPKDDDYMSTSHRSWKYLKQRFKDYLTLKHQEKIPSEDTPMPLSSSLLVHIGGNNIKNMIKEFSTDAADKIDVLDKVFESIEDFCLPNFILLYERFKFFTMQQKKLESNQKFVAKLQMMGDYCELQEHYGKYLIGRIVNSIYCDTLRERLQGFKNLDLEKVLEICNSGETVGTNELAVKSVKSEEEVTKSGPGVSSERKNCNKESAKSMQITAKESKLKQQERNKVICSKSEEDTEAAFNVHESLLVRQTRSSTLANRSKQTVDLSVPKKRNRKSKSNPALSVISGESITAVNCIAPDIKTFSKQDRNLNFSSNLVFSSVTNISEPVNSIGLAYIPEDVVLNEICNKSESWSYKEEMTAEAGLDCIDEKDVKNVSKCQLEKRDGERLRRSKNSGNRKCLICGLTFATAYKLMCHTKSHTSQKLYRCGLCGRGFIHCGSRSRHMRQTHPESLMFRCDECDMLFERQKALDQHKLSHSKEEKITCDKCGACFTSTKEHFHHQRREHRNTRYKCDKCGLHFPFPSKLKLHLMSKHDATKPFMCEVCGSSFAERNMLNIHKNTHSGEKKHECPICGRRFLLKTTLSNHIQTHRDRKPHMCEVCGVGFKLSYYLKSHMKTHAMIRERPHVCSKCGAAFLKSTQLRNHERKHTGEKPYRCEICNSVFSQLSSMKKHVKHIHQGLKPKDRFSCEYCGLSFTHSCKLKLHLMKHTGERPFICKVCGSTYRENHQLTSHMKIHSGNEPYKCPICGQRFLQKSSMEGHVRKHTGEKPFRCPICSLHFSHKGYLRDHIKTHDENRERKYKCSVCDKAFTCSSHMRSHERLHSGEKPYKCDICGSRFTKRSSVKKHLRRTHGIHESSSQHAQSSAPVENFHKVSSVTLTQLQAADVIHQRVHSESHAEICQGSEHPANLQVQPQSEICSGIDANISAELRPVLHSDVGMMMHSHLHQTQVQSDTAPKSHPEMPPQLHQVISSGLGGGHMAVQQHQHSFIHIIHPHIHTAMHSQINPPVLTAMSTNPPTQIQQPGTVQELRVYTLAS